MRMKKNLVLLTVAALLVTVSTVPIAGVTFNWTVYTEGKEVWNVGYEIDEIYTFLLTEGTTYSSQFTPATSGTFYFELHVDSENTEATAYLEYYNSGWQTYTSLYIHTSDELYSIAPRILGFGSKIQPIQKPPSYPPPQTKYTSVSLSPSYSYRIKLVATRDGEGTSVDVDSRVYRKWEWCYVNNSDSGSASCTSASWSNVDTYNAPLTPTHGGTIKDIEAWIVDNSSEVDTKVSAPDATSGNVQARIDYAISISNVYPNPAYGGTNRKVQYTLNADGYVKAEVRNTLGQLVHTENYGWVTACTNREVVFWDGSGVAAGTYYVRFKVWNSEQSAYSNTKSFTVL
jgi:hypothetical protein